MSQAELSLIITTFQMPWHLHRVLSSVACQTARDRMEVIVTDDGSKDSTQQVVEDFCRSSGLSIKFVTKPHEGFHLTRCRNNGARAATAPYLLFLDGDCLIPQDHVEQYLLARRQGYVHFGYCCRLEQHVSEQIADAEILQGELQRFSTKQELRKLTKLHWKSLFYQWIGHQTKPALKGGNIGIWRADYERLNGFDENFRDWGCEDDDLSYRVRGAGLRVASVLGRTRTYHLWHPPASSKPATKWSQGVNVAYLKRRGRLSQCMNGLRTRSLHDLRVSIAGSPADSRFAHQFVGDHFDRALFNSTGSEIEFLFHPGQGSFSGKSDCNVLVAENGSLPSPLQVSKADVTIAPNHEGLRKLESFLDGRQNVHFDQRAA